MGKTYVIGEIGQNHNGSVDIAKLLVDVVSRPIHDKLFNNTLPTMDAVKLTKRDLNQELSQSQMDKPYNTPNSFGKTYGEHREYLELSDEEHFEVYKYAKEKGLDFVETLCAAGCLSMFRYFTPDKLKVASRDLTNLPLLAALAETKVPLIISTGMAGKKELDDAIDVITKYHNELSVLHCVSEYPTKYENVNLRTITYLKNNYPESIVLFRMGDFYETFEEDAQITSEILGITLTKRANGAASSVPLAGFPYHAYNQYVHKLLEAGYKVALCEQVENPKEAKGIVKRSVVEVLTPGTAISTKYLNIRLLVESRLL